MNINFPIAYSELFNHNIRFPGIDEDFIINIALPYINQLYKRDIDFIKKGGPNNDFNNLPIFIIQSHGVCA